MERACCCCGVDNVMPTEECNVDVNGLILMLRDGVKAAQFILHNATTNKMQRETDNIVWKKGKEERLLFFRLCGAALGHCQSDERQKI
jgi:hypothetical protein